MKPDYLFVGAGFAFLAYSAYMAVTGARSRQRHIWVCAALWSLFAVGLLIRGFAPHLEIKNHAFYIPSNLQSQGNIPDLVARQKLMHLISGILTCVAALGIAFYYFLQPKVTRIMRSVSPQEINSAG